MLETDSTDGVGNDAAVVGAEATEKAGIGMAADAYDLLDGKSSAAGSVGEDKAELTGKEGGAIGADRRAVERDGAGEGGLGAGEGAEEG